MFWLKRRGRSSGALPSRSYDPARPLISIHVPKGGGSTVRDNLGAWFGERLREHYADEAQARLPIHWPLAAAMCVHGHFNNRCGFGVTDYYPDADQFITFLRDPLELHVSLYFYLKQHQGSYHRAGRLYRVQEEFPDLGAFIEGICRDREHPLALSFLHYMPKHLAIERDPHLLFKHFLHVGITAELDDSLLVLARKLNMPRLAPRHLNAAPRDEAVAYREWRPLHEHHYRVEHEIYREAVERHRREFAALSDAGPGKGTDGATRLTP